MAITYIFYRTSLVVPANLVAGALDLTYWQGFQRFAISVILVSVPVWLFFRFNSISFLSGGRTMLRTDGLMDCEARGVGFVFAEIDASVRRFFAYL